MNEEEREILQKLIVLLEEGRQLRQYYNDTELTQLLRLELLSERFYAKEDEIGRFIVANAEALGRILSRQKNYTGIGQSAISKSRRMIKSLRYILEHSE